MTILVALLFAAPWTALAVYTYLTSPTLRRQRADRRFARHHPTRR